jgi:hypothetical protein
MKKAMISIGLVAVLMFGISPAWADTEWNSGHHDIWDGDIYAEIWMRNDATADMWGGNVYELGALDSSIFSMYGGTMDIFLVRHNSIVNIYGGDLSRLMVYGNENGMVNLYAKDIVYHTTGGYWNNGWIEGSYLNDIHFDFDIPSIEVASHINIIPEPTTILLLGIGSILLRKRR